MHREPCEAKVSSEIAEDSWRRCSDNTEEDPAQHGNAVEEMMGTNKND